MNAVNCPGIRPLPMSMNRLCPAAAGMAGDASPLEAARQALIRAKTRLEEHRNEQIEHALDGYLALRSRQTSYESGLDVQRKQLEDFQALDGRRNELSAQLSDARAEYEACAVPDITRYNRVSFLERELTAANHSITALVDQANRYASSQRQYAGYLEDTGQGGYAAYEYRGQAEYTAENFVSETTGLADRLEAGAAQWRERVSSYCGQFGLTPSDFECYLQQRRELGDAYSAARQRLAELLRAAERAAPEEPRQDGAGSGTARFDTVETGDAWDKLTPRQSKSY